MFSIDKYKDVTTTRGFKYHYYYVAAQGTKPTLLFNHGYPSSSQDWHRIVPHFEQQGYGIIVPDALGYGGTDKPTDPAVYKGTLLAKDLVDILDAEKLDKVIAVGHDWYETFKITPVSRRISHRNIYSGSWIISRLANVAPERVSAYVFLDVGYVTPNPDANFEADLQATKKIYGYDLYGYQAFFASDEAAEVLEKNVSNS